MSDYYILDPSEHKLMARQGEKRNFNEAFGDERSEYAPIEKKASLEDTQMSGENLKPKKYRVLKANLHRANVEIFSLQCQLLGQQAQMTEEKLHLEKENHQLQTRLKDSEEHRKEMQAVLCEADEEIGQWACVFWSLQCQMLAQQAQMTEEKLHLEKENHQLQMRLKDREEDIGQRDHEIKSLQWQLSALQAQRTEKIQPLDEGDCL